MKVLKFYNSQSPRHESEHLTSTFNALKYKIYFPIEEIDISSSSSSSVVDQYNVTVNPTVILINDDGEIRRISGIYSVQELDQFLGFSGF